MINRSIEEKKAALLIELRKCYGIITLACKRLGVGRTAFYEYKKNDEQFAHDVEEIESDFVDYAESRLFEMIRIGDRGAVMFYLKSKGKDRGYR